MQKSHWPHEYGSAVSFSFDDARESQVDIGLPLFSSHGVYASFYVSPEPFRRRQDAWRRAAEAGNEIGNHTMNHPCCRNFKFTGELNLESYTLEMIRYECDTANEMIRDVCGKTAGTFAYPCGQMYVGTGIDTRSYVPVIAERFYAARCFAEGAVNLLHRCNLHQLAAFDSDCKPYEYLISVVEHGIEAGGWVVFAGHEIGDTSRPQTTGRAELDGLIVYLRETHPEVWIDTVGNIAAHVSHVQSAGFTTDAENGR